MRASLLILAMVSTRLIIAMELAQEYIPGSIEEWEKIKLLVERLDTHTTQIALSPDDSIRIPAIRTSLDIAVEQDDLAQVSYLHRIGINLDAPYGEYRQAALLHKSIVHSSWTVTRYLLAEDADATGLYFGHTLLHSAIQKKCPLDICEQLIKKGNDVNQPDVEGKTALHIAAETGSLEGVRFLLERGALPNEADNFDATPLEVAVLLNYTDVVSLLLQGSADPNRKNRSGTTVLHDAASDYRIAILRLLLQHGADVNATNTANNTALHFAASSNNPEAVRFLLANGADPRRTNKDGKTPRDQTQNTEIQALLKKTELIANLMEDETRPQDIAELIASFVYP